MFKLYRLGVKDKLWKIIDDCDTNTVSSIENFFFKLMMVLDKEGGLVGSFVFSFL